MNNVCSDHNRIVRDKKGEQAGSIKSSSISGLDSGAPKRSLTSSLVQLLLIDED